MYRRMDDFLKDYAGVAADTAKVFAQLTDANLGQTIAPRHRSLGGIAWHIVVSVPEMMNRLGLGLTAADQEAPPPGSAATVRSAQEKVAAELLERLRAGWTDATLDRTDDMYGQTWTRGFTLTALVQHEIHHRGQMSVLLRQAGALVPGCFGPSREEWTAMGMEPPPY